MRDRVSPCIYYVCAGEECQKHFKDVTLAKCKNCAKYRPRKQSKRPESIKERRRKDTERHDNWRSRI